jgi:hypothetical protein
MARTSARNVKPSLSEDRFDKFMAATSWYVGRKKDDPEFLRSPNYYAAVSEWFEGKAPSEGEAVH